MPPQSQHVQTIKGLHIPPGIMMPPGIVIITLFGNQKIDDGMKTTDHSVDTHGNKVERLVSIPWVRPLSIP